MVEEIKEEEGRRRKRRRYRVREIEEEEEKEEGERKEMRYDNMFHLRKRSLALITASCMESRVQDLSRRASSSAERTFLRGMFSFLALSPSFCPSLSVPMTCSPSVISLSSVCNVFGN